MSTHEIQHQHGKHTFGQREGAKKENAKDGGWNGCVKCHTRGFWMEGLTLPLGHQIIRDQKHILTDLAQHTYRDSGLVAHRIQAKSPWTTRWQAYVRTHASCASLAVKTSTFLCISNSDKARQIYYYHWSLGLESDRGFVKLAARRPMSPWTSRRILRAFRARILERSSGRDVKAVVTSGRFSSQGYCRRQSQLPLGPDKRSLRTGSYEQDGTEGKGESGNKEWYN